MGIWSEKIKELRTLPNPYGLLYITANVLGGVGVGVLLAKWLPTTTWWIFIIIACVIAIPVIWRLLRK